jgi:hypothetical protein
MLYPELVEGLPKGSGWLGWDLLLEIKSNDNLITLWRLPWQPR